MSFQLTNTKTADNKRTLLHFLSEAVEKKHPDLMSFPEELMHSEAASRGESSQPFNAGCYMQFSLKSNGSCNRHQRVKNVILLTILFSNKILSIDF